MYFARANLAFAPICDTIQSQFHQQSRELELQALFFCKCMHDSPASKYMSFLRYRLIGVSVLDADVVHRGCCDVFT
jgi:hypothetical protein